MDLYELNPDEFMAYHYVVAKGGRVTGDEVAQVVKRSRATGARALKSLVDKGLIMRFSRGRYLVVEVSPVIPEVSPMRLRSLSISTSSTSNRPTRESNDSLVGGAAPRLEGYRTKEFPMDLPLGKITNDLPGPSDDLTEERPKRKAPTKYHRKDTPFSDWGISHMVKEWGIRALHAYPTRTEPFNSRLLSIQLGKRRAAGMQMQQMVTAMDQFFDHHAHKASGDPVRAFIDYLDRYLAQQPTDPVIDREGYNIGWE